MDNQILMMSAMSSLPAVVAPAPAERQEPQPVLSPSVRLVDVKFDDTPRQTIDELFESLGGGQGTVDKAQLEAVCKRLGINYSSRKLGLLAARLDPLGEGEIGSSRFYKWLILRDRKKKRLRITASLGALLEQLQQQPNSSTARIDISGDLIAQITRGLCRTMHIHVDDDEITRRVAPTLSRTFSIPDYEVGLSP